MKTDFLKFRIEKDGLEQAGKTVFRDIADILFHKFAIQTHYTTYRLIEIEFYWADVNNDDKSVYKRTHIKPESGQWFHHYSGVDIALRDDEVNGYGGILIRKIQDTSDGQVYGGPMVSAMKLFSGTDAFGKSKETKFFEKEFPKTDITPAPRVGLGDNAEKSGTKDLCLNYTINPKYDFDNLEYIP